MVYYFCIYDPFWLFLGEMEIMAKNTGKLSILPARAVDEGILFPAAFKTLAALCIYVNKEGTCYPRLKTLGDRLGVSKQAVSRQIKILVEKGYLVSKSQYRSDGSRAANLYRVIYDHQGSGIRDQVSGSQKKRKEKKSGTDFGKCCVIDESGERVSSKRKRSAGKGSYKEGSYEDRLLRGLSRAVAKSKVGVCDEVL